MQEIVQRVMLGYTKSIEKRNPFALMHNKKSNLLKTPFAFLLLLYTLCAFRPAILWKPHFIFTTSYDYFKLLPRLRLAFLHVFYVYDALICQIIIGVLTRNYNLVIEAPIFLGTTSPRFKQTSGLKTDTPYNSVCNEKMANS